jgi:hypothetical protein
LTSTLDPDVRRQRVRVDHVVIFDVRLDEGLVDLKVLVAAATERDSHIIISSAS